MATISSIAAGLWSATGTWGGGVVPGAGDKVNIGHAVTLDGTVSAGDGTTTSVNINNGGVLRASRTVVSQLTLTGALVVNTGGEFDFGKQADPIPAAVSATLVLNQATNLYRGLLISGTGKFGAWGESTRTRYSPLVGDVAAGATAFTVADATGWLIGDEVMLPHSTLAATSNYETEFRTITGIAGNVVSVAALTFAHLAGVPVANLNTNVTLKSGSLSFLNYSQFACTAATAANGIQLGWCKFLDMGGSNTNAMLGIAPAGTFTAIGASPFLPMEGVVFRHSGSTGNATAAITHTGTKFLVDASQTVFALRGGAGTSDAALTGGGLIRLDGFVASAFKFLSNTTGAVFAGSRFSDGWICVQGGYLADSDYSVGVDWSAIRLFGRGVSPLALVSALHDFSLCDLGATYGWSATAGDAFFSASGLGQRITVMLEDCLIAPALENFHSAASTIYQTAGLAVRVINKNVDAAVQELYTESAKVSRDNAPPTGFSGTALKVAPLAGAINPTTFKLNVYAPTGKPVTASGYLQRDAAFNGTTTVTLSGLGITPSVWTFDMGAASGIRQQFLVGSTNTGNSGMLNLSFTITGTAGNVWLDGISAPTPIAVSSGEFDYWIDALPVPVVSANFVAAADIWNVQTSEMTLTGSVGRRVVELVRRLGLDAAHPLVDDGTHITSADIDLLITEAAGTVTVARQ